MNSIAFRINLIKQRINKALSDNQRPADSINLLGVSKTRNVEEIKKAYAAGLRCFGENRLQEALPKLSALKDYDIEWHFIGRVQANKIRKIAQHFSWVQSVDSKKTAQLFSDHYPQNSTPLNVCIQVNIDNDPNKAGTLPSDVLPLANFIAQLPHLNLRGLMTVLEKHDKLEDDQKSYRHLKQIYDELNANGFNLDTLSMGMSADFEAAIAEGATLIRVGKNLFGPFEE